MIKSAIKHYLLTNAENLLLRAVLSNPDMYFHESTSNLDEKSKDKAQNFKNLNAQL